jgi:hypothetical protein
MGLAALVGLGLAAKPAVASITTEQSASILVFPKVIANGDRNTIIQITNTSNSIRFAHCFYVDAELDNPALPESATNHPRWTEIDFDIVLTKQQPTHWVVSTGRALPSEEPLTCRNVVCNPATSGTTLANCCDSGLDPGRVPPVSPTFVGELKCIEVDTGGAPIGGNALKGEATIETPATGDVSKYNAVGIKGFDNNDRDNTLCLGGDVSTDCPMGAEYEACPDRWFLDGPVVGAPDSIVANTPCPAGSTCSSVLDTTLTVVPCSEDFERQAPRDIVLQFVVTNEFETSFSGSTTFRCWKSFSLDELANGAFTFGNLGSSVAVARVRSLLATPSDDNPVPDGPPAGSGVIFVVEETHVLNVTTGGVTQTSITRAANNGHLSPLNKTVADIIVIPGGQGGDQP